MGRNSQTEQPGQRPYAPAWRKSRLQDKQESEEGRGRRQRGGRVSSWSWKLAFLRGKPGASAGSVTASDLYFEHSGSHAERQTVKMFYPYNANCPT